MKYFESLGLTLASELGSRNFDNEVFPDLAIRALERSRLCESVTVEEISEWAAAADWLPYQPTLESNFGEWPVTLFWHPHFYIEALHWTFETTAIHQHGFSGAFAILEGSSVQSRYTFEREKRVNPRMSLGKLQLQDVKLLDKGSLEPIRSGADLIHSVCHLDVPSVTIVIRTHSDIENQPQYSYRRPCLAIDPFYSDPTVTRRVQMLSFLGRVKSPRLADHAEQALASSDLYGAYRILEHLRLSLAGANVFDRLARVARDRHGADVDRLLVVLDELDREAVISSRRASTGVPAHQLLLGLLMSLPSRDAILDIVGRKFAGRDAREMVAQWAFDLSGLDSCGVEFDDLNRSLFRFLLDGRPVSEVVSRVMEQDESLKAEAGEDQLAEHCRQLQQSIFRPLLQAT